jgi:methylenetetrahydrofolate reductase (NADPH)
MITPLYSVELFPPKTAEGMAKLKLEISQLNTLNPAYFSVTYGAGGSTREGTLDTVNWLRELNIDTAPHLACIGSTSEQVRELLTHYQTLGIKRLVALRGDMPSGMGAGERGNFHYANELVQFVRTEFSDAFSIEVAAYPEYHPQSSNPARDFENFKRKVDAGADGAITQYFYNADAYFAFVTNCQRSGINIPIIPGIMPITNYTQLARCSDTCGAEIPRWIRRQLEGFGDDVESIRAFGHEVVLNLCQQLIAGGAPGLHFYTMNQSAPIVRLWTELHLPTK